MEKAHTLGGHEQPRKQSTARSTESVLRSSSSEEDDERGRVRRHEAEFARIATAQTERSDADAGRIRHAGFFGYEGMMESDSPSTPNFVAPPRRRMLPASRQSTNSVLKVRLPSFGSTPEGLGEVLADQADGKHPVAAVSRGSSPYAERLTGSLARSPYRSPYKSPGSNMAWSAEKARNQHPTETPEFPTPAGHIQLRASQHLSPSRHVPTTGDFARPPQTSGSRSPQKEPPVSRPALVAMNVKDANFSQDRWRSAADGQSKAEHVPSVGLSTTKQDHFEARRLGSREPPTSLAAQSGQYGQAASVLENMDSSAFQKLKAVRTLGQLYAVGMFEARQPLLRAVDCESKMVRIAAIHELMAAPVTSHALGMDQRIELGRILTRTLDEPDHGSGLAMQVAALSALSHFFKGGAGGGLCDAYMLGVIAALCDSQDTDLRCAAVKAMGSVCSAMDAHYCDRLRPRLRDSDPSVREQAVRTLASIAAWGGGDDLATGLMECASNDPNPAVQRAAGDALVAALNGSQAASARAVMKRVLLHRTDLLQNVPLVLLLVEQTNKRGET